MLLLSFACTHPTEVESPTWPDTTAPHHPIAALSAEEATAALKEAVRFGIPLTPPLIDTWQELMSHGDEQCPGHDWEFNALEVFPTEGCTAQSGYWYQGVGSGNAGWVDYEQDGIVDQYREGMKTDGSMRDAAGNSFLFGGDMLFTFDGDPARAGTFEASFLGTYSYGGAEGNWLKEGASTSSYLSGTIDDEGTWTLVANGGFTVGTESVNMDQFSMNTACAGMPSGTIGVRDTEGYWYDLQYDESSCDGCGEVTFDGREDLGRSCFDVGPAFAMAFGELVARVRRLP